MKTILLFFLIVASNPFFAQEHFLRPFSGKYSGTMFICRSNGTCDSVPVELHLSNTDNPFRVSSNMRYLPTNGSTIEKNYELVLDSVSNDGYHYLMDEKNGILLFENRVNNRFYSLYEVENMLYHVSTTYSAQEIVFDLTVYSKEKTKQSKVIEDGDEFKVDAFPFIVSQYVILHRQ